VIEMFFRLLDEHLVAGKLAHRVSGRSPRPPRCRVLRCRRSNTALGSSLASVMSRLRLKRQDELPVGGRPEHRLAMPLASPRRCAGNTRFNSIVSAQTDRLLVLRVCFQSSADTMMQRTFFAVIGDPQIARPSRTLDPAR